MKAKLSALESFWYYFNVIFTFGLWYTVKVVIKKAVIEANETKAQ